MRAASPPLLLPSTSHRTNIPEAEIPPRKRACLTTPALGLEIEDSLAAGAARQPGTTLEAGLRRDRVMETGYGITDTWDEIVEAMLEVAPTTLEGVNQRVTKLATTVRQENEESQVRFEDAQDNRVYLRAQVNTLFRDRPYHRHTAMILDREAMYARLAWTSFEDRSAAIEAHVRTLEAQKMAPSKRTARASPAIMTTPTSTPITDAQLRTLIERGVAAVLAERDGDKSRNGDNSHDSGIGRRRQASTVRKCQPMNFKGTEGVVGLTQWVVGHDVAYAIPWKTLKKMRTDKYYLRDVVEKYVGGLPDMIHESVKASKPKTMHEAIEFATKLMDKKILTITEHQAKNKRKFEDTS
ncbi:hypothetical protein Tco_0553641 [Tanacetum coccineum]